MSVKPHTRHVRLEDGFLTKRKYFAQIALFKFGQHRFFRRGSLSPVPETNLISLGNHRFGAKVLIGIHPLILLACTLQLLAYEIYSQRKDSIYRPSDQTMNPVPWWHTYRATYRYQLVPVPVNSWYRYIASAPFRLPKTGYYTVTVLRYGMDGTVHGEIIIAFSFQCILCARTERACIIVFS